MPKIFKNFPSEISKNKLKSGIFFGLSAYWAIILIGTNSLNFDSKFLFALGVIISSFIFFFSLGYFSKYLSNLVCNPNSNTYLLFSIFSIFLFFCFFWS